MEHITSFIFHLVSYHVVLCRFHAAVIYCSIAWNIFQENERAVTREEGLALAQEHKYLFLECSAKTKENVQHCFKDLTLKVHYFKKACICIKNVSIACWTLPHLVIFQLFSIGGQNNCSLFWLVTPNLTRIKA